MADVLVDGGPGGPGTAPCTAKNGLETAVFGTDETGMHEGRPFGNPGIGSSDGSDDVAALRERVDVFGVDRHRGGAVTVGSDTDAGVLDVDVPADAEGLFGSVVDAD